MKILRSNKYLLSILLFSVFAMGFAFSLQGTFILSKSAEQALREQSKQMFDAALRGDDAAVVNSMYPKVVNIMGGAEQARKKVETSRQSVKQDGGVMVSNVLGNIRGCAKVQEQVQCVIDGTQVMRIPGGRLNILTETIAFSEDEGRHWTFLNGGQGPEALRTNLPELSPDLPLRKQPQPRFEND